MLDEFTKNKISRYGYQKKMKKNSKKETGKLKKEFIKRNYVGWRQKQSKRRRARSQELSQ